MNISTESLLKLKCSECDCFLSRIPIHLKEDGSAICGRCPIPDSENSEEQIKVFRMKPYENLAQNVIFPCMYENNGCPEKRLYLDLKNHEEMCKFRPFVCPVVPVGNCDWIGCQNNFYEHCQSRHLSRILEHPCVFKHNVTENNVESYVTKAFNVLFLIHTKVCLTRHKIYHSVHCLDNATNISCMYFELIILKEHDKIIKRGKIAPVGSKMINENLSLSCGINSLIETLNGFDNVNFAIKIVCTLSCKICNSISNNLIEGNYCNDCNLRRKNCKHSTRGCSYKDIDIKTNFHERNLCKFSNWCWICMKHKENPPILSKHYVKDHPNAIHKGNVFWNITEGMFNLSKKQYDFLINSEFGEFFCTLFIFDQNFLIEICSAALKTEEKCKLKCMVSIKSSRVKDIKEIDLVFYVNHNIDWYSTFPKDYLFSYTSSYQIKVDLFKID